MLYSCVFCIVDLAHHLKDCKILFAARRVQCILVPCCLYKKMCGYITCQACICKCGAKSKPCLNTVDVQTLCFPVELYFWWVVQQTLLSGAKKENDLWLIDNPSAPSFCLLNFLCNTLRSSESTGALLVKFACIIIDRQYKII